MASSVARRFLGLYLLRPLRGSITRQLRQRLRILWVIVDDPCRGRGIGKELVRRSLEFCRRAGFARVFFWTVEGLPESFALYMREGFRVLERIADDRYSVARVSLLMERDLP